ncbi:MAG: hypothetical protein Q9219_004972 [cf. Caloplaca sp. 3 TL-2023]
MDSIFFQKHLLHDLGVAVATYFNDARFRFLRNDADIIVISNKYIDEIRSLPTHVISPIQAHVDNLLGRYSTTDILLESDLHSRMLQTKLTPNLGKFVPDMRKELMAALDDEVPSCRARISARIFVGSPLCRNEEWLETSIRYTENVFRTVVAMRLFPQFMQPLVSFFVPQAWKVPMNLHRAQKLIVPLVIERKQLQLSPDPSYTKPNDLLQWMIDAANESEGKPEKLAHRQLLLTLAAIHTSTMAATHAIFDLCAMPEYIQPIRDEVREAVQIDKGWQKQTLSRLHKLDSFLKESQRVTPPSLQVTSEPMKFDGFRYYRERQKPGEEHRHQFATTDGNNLHFGHGKYACPGRFFASNEIKLILATIILKYDMRFPEGQARPLNMSAHEYIFPDPDGIILLKERDGADKSE